MGLARGVFGALVVLLLTATTPAAAEENGIAAKRPVFAGACRNCPWGELADFVAHAMAPAGWNVQICANCNRADSPRFVAERRAPPPLSPADAALGDPPPPSGLVDFGVTDALRAKWAYDALYDYKDDKPHKNLRLVALIEDPYYLVVAVKSASGITDLAQVAAQQKPLRILTEGGPLVEPVLAHYGLTRDKIEAWGGKVEFIMAREKPDFDVMISALASLADNPESNAWYELSVKDDLRYLSLPPDLLAEMAGRFGLQQVDLPYAYLRGLDRPVPTVARSGDAIITRDDVPDDFAYAVAKAIDEGQGRLKWYDRPYSYDIHTVTKDFDLPLHPGAARYYQEVGYLK